MCELGAEAHLCDAVAPWLQQSMLVLGATSELQASLEMSGVMKGQACF